MINLEAGEKFDDLEIKGYKIIQSKEKFCFGIDAVLLSDFSNVRKGEKVLDLGCGNGIIPILMEAKTKGEHFSGLEIQKEVADMARRSVAYNNLEDKINIVLGDIKKASEIFGKNSFDVITSNPPYMEDTHGLKNPELPKAIARHELHCSFEDIAREASYLLKPGGRFYLVHRPRRLVELITTLKNKKIEPKKIRMVHPSIEKEANMVLIEAVRGGKPMMKVEKPLIVYKEKGKYTDEIYEIYGYQREEI